MNLSLFVLFFLRNFTELIFLECTAAFGLPVHLLHSCVIAKGHLENGNPGAGGQAGFLDRMGQSTSCFTDNFTVSHHEEELNPDPMAWTSKEGWPGQGMQNTWEPFYTTFSSPWIAFKVTKRSKQREEE